MVVEEYMKQKKVTVIFTCFNRKEKTKTCIKSLLDQNQKLEFTFVVVDDGSKDGTTELLERWKQDGTAMEILHGDGNLYWAGGMRKGIAYAKEKSKRQETSADYYLLVNDDVEFFPGVIDRMVEEAEHIRVEQNCGTVLVGPMCDEKGEFSYGGIRYGKGIHYEEVHPTDENRSCDSFNMNCLLLDQDTFVTVPNFDTHYIHSLADFDYGLEMKRRKIPMQVVPYFVGTCPDNDPKGGWTDRSLSRRERLKKKENIKGAPFAPWFYFLKKNFGLGQALLHGFTPYLRIIMGK